jgi:hypothetical protein
MNSFKVRNLIRGEEHYTRDLSDAGNLQIDRIFKARRIAAVGTPAYDSFRAPYYEKPHIECGEGHVLLALLALGYTLVTGGSVEEEGFVESTQFHDDLIPYVLRAPDRLMSIANRRESGGTGNASVQSEDNGSVQSEE